MQRAAASGVLAEAPNAQTVAASSPPRRRYPPMYIVSQTPTNATRPFCHKPVEDDAEALPARLRPESGRPIPWRPSSKSVGDLTSGVLNGNLKYQLTESAALPGCRGGRGLLPEIFAHLFARPTAIATWLGRNLQIGFPNVSIKRRTRKLAQEYTYRYLAPPPHLVRRSMPTSVFEPAAAEPEPSSAELRAWAKASACRCHRGRLRPQILQAWRRPSR